MSAGVESVPEGGYRYLPGAAPYSAGVAALPGFEIERVRFPDVLPLDLGFRRIEEHLRRVGRPLAAFCACELRSPRPFTETGFTEFNGAYRAVLEAWKLLRNGVNPVARSNVCPEQGAPAGPGFFAFTYTVRARPGGRPGFVIAGSGEAPEGKSNYRDHIVRRGDVSPGGLLEKARWVLGEQERRLAALGLGWGDVTATQLYTVHDPVPFLADELVRRGAMRGGLIWHYARPPVMEIEVELDCRGCSRELVPGEAIPGRDAIGSSPPM